jgi:hypothetical protein
LDLDSCGQEVPKTATISQESRQRAKCLTHENQVELRLERERLLQAEEERKIASKINKHQQVLHHSEACSAKVGGQEATLQLFSKATVQELKAFVFARSFKNIDESWKPPNKGKPEEAEAGADNLIKRAFDCHNKPIILEKPSDAIAVPSSQATNNTRHSEATVVSIEPSKAFFSNADQKASRFLSTHSWVLQVLTALDPNGHCAKAPEIQEPSLLQKADLLQTKLEQRLQFHCQLRIKDKNKREHWCLQWSAKNFPQMAAIMVLFNHVKTDISCLDHNQCLLAGPTFFLKATNREAHMEGCYLHFDSNNNEWIRSGKAVGSTFGQRNVQHKLASRLTSASSENSKFYHFYPSIEAAIVDKRVKKGSFENLQQHVGVGFDKLRKGKLLVDVEQGGIFHLDNETNKRIDAINFRGNLRLQTKQLNMLGYLWELAYDLCIAPASNVSGNPGFEVLLGVSK